MSDDKDHLFRDTDLSDFLRSRDEQMRNEIGQFGSEYVLKVSLDDLTAHLTDKYSLEPIVLLRDQIHIGASGDTKMDVSGKPQYGVRNHGEPFYVPATFAEFVVPFTGDSILLRFQPSTFNFNPPRARIVGQELCFRYMRTDHENAAFRADFDRELENVSNHIGWE